MADIKTAVANKPVWVDLSSDDAAASRDFYSKLFGWKVEVNPDPNYGGYGMAQIGDKAVAGIGPKMSPQAPTAWNLYIGTEDAKSLAGKVEAAGGKVLAPPMQVGEQGTMAVFQDPSGAVISAWQPDAMSGVLPSGSPGTYCWAELNARGVDKALPFYKAVFGWTAKPSDIGGGMVYNEFQLDGQSIAGGQEMMSMVPAEVPSHWMIYFGVDDVDASFKKAMQIGAKEFVSPMDFPGGRFAIVGDPQGASFGLLKMNPR
jgi:predicted enzyme related to lactoylglutathione lyase